jgi:putative SOS response-associated peptidase YedK
MCGRFTQIPITIPGQVPWPALRADFALLPARYNLAPSQTAGVVVRDGDETRLIKLQWGLLPFWAKELAFGQHTFNARIETVDDKPAFRAAFKTRHAAIPISGYYEWKTTETGKQPYYLRPEHAQDMLWVAGLWEPRHPLQGDGVEGSFTLITQPAEGIPAEVHSRMPVFLEAREVDDWLGLGRGPSLPFLLTRSLPALKCFPVAKRVNKGVDDDTGLIEPIALTP